MTGKKITTITVDNQAQGMDSFLETVERVGSELMTVRHGRRDVAMTMAETVIRKTAQLALGGSSQSTRQFNEDQRRAAQARAHEIRMDVDYYTARKKQQAKEYAAYREVHGRDPLDFPHPDDIEIDPRRGVRIKGPIDHAEYTAMRHTQRTITACLWQEALDQRLRGIVIDEAPFGGMMVVAMLLNDTLPKRERRDDHALLQALMRHSRATKRALLTQTRAAWLDAGYVVARGAPSHDQNTITTLLTCAAQAMHIGQDPHRSREDKAQDIDQVIYDAFG